MKRKEQDIADNVWYLSPAGNDAWSGLLPEPNRKKNDGPLRSLQGLRSKLRSLKDGENYRKTSLLSSAPTCHCGPVTVYMRGGFYPMAEPFVLTAKDSWPLEISAYPGETPVISGGSRITDWVETRVHGRRAWRAELPEVANGSWHFRQLFVNGKPAPRPRLPKKGLFKMREIPGVKLPCGWGNGGQTQFVCNQGDVSRFHDLSNVEVVYLHFWIEERTPIRDFEPASNMVTMLRPSVSALVAAHGSEPAEYYLDNVFEALSEPGEWYLDRLSGLLYYLPAPGQTPANTEIIAPRCLQLLVLQGDAGKGEYVEHVRFRGVKFAHTDWRHPDVSDGAVFVGPDAGRSPHSRRFRRGNSAAAAQAANDVPGVIYFEAARFCGLEQCVIENLGWYGVEIADACHGLTVLSNSIRNMGAGGIKINGAAASDLDVAIKQTGGHVICDNEIAFGGLVFHSAVGVLSMNAHSMSICHNHIHDLFYSAISCGWEWGYQENISRDNLIAFNHIHDIGKKLLSDMGGIYTLGVQPGTVIRNNLIYSISSARYGGWCIYPDEGSSHILIENNVCYDADRQLFHQHYGRENIVRNNIWCFGGESLAAYSRAEPHCGFTWLRNIMLGSGEPMYKAAHSLEAAPDRVQSDLNIFYSTKGKPVFEVAGKKLSFKQWQAAGMDLHSLVADPKFINPHKRDFRLKPDSPACKLGFKPIDISNVGPRNHKALIRACGKKAESNK